ncbi:hypothetical protein [Corynebacterium ulceribovis]|uniref:hypothetical protein n=1 Tax=Corynebacterium ulceribovis TaxID=487732 RepID=UPI00037A7A26|nr:hypothetical protein [Corynebacterium ulceribovis]
MNAEKATQYRRAAYAVIAAIMAVLTAIGVITGAQADSWLAIGEKLIDIIAPLAATIALTVAAKKTNRGSDDPTTAADVDAALATGIEQGRAAEREAAVSIIDIPAPQETEPAAADLPAYDLDSTND